MDKPLIIITACFVGLILGCTQTKPAEPEVKRIQIDPIEIKMDLDVKISNTQTNTEASVQK